MIKAKINSNAQAALDYIEEIKRNPLLSEYHIDLNNVNDFANMLEEKKHCSSCKGLAFCMNSANGFYSNYSEGKFVLTPCHFKKQAFLKSKENELINTLFVSKSILSANISDFDATTSNRKKIYEYIVEFIQTTNRKEFMKGLYIHGGFSTGKTFILGCIANELARNKIKCLIIYFPDLVVELKSAIGTPRFDVLINYLKSVDVLFLDDLGSENMTPWLRDDILGPILNYRLMEEMPLFVSSNVDPKTEDLLNHFSITKSPSDRLKAKRIISRLEGLVKPIELDNNSYRR